MSFANEGIIYAVAYPKGRALAFFLSVDGAPHVQLERRNLTSSLEAVALLEEADILPAGGDEATRHQSADVSKALELQLAVTT